MSTGLSWQCRGLWFTTVDEGCLYLRGQFERDKWSVSIQVCMSCDYVCVHEIMLKLKYEVENYCLKTNTEVHLHGEVLTTIFITLIVRVRLELKYICVE